MLLPVFLLLGRYKWEKKKPPTPDCFAAIEIHAGISATLILSVKKLAPQEEWTDDVMK